jgi:hypothetical protein
MESPYAYFRITEKAGRFVAGRNNPGVGTPLLLSRREAEHDVRLGALVEVGKEPASDTAADALEDATLGGKGSEGGDIDLNKLTVKELRSLAEENGLTIEDGATKGEIIAAIEGSAA